MQNFARKHPYLTVAALVALSLTLAIWLGEDEWRFWFITFLLLLVPTLFLIMVSAGYQRVEPNTIVIRRGPGDELWAFTRRPWQPGKSEGHYQSRGQNSHLPPHTSDSGAYLLIPPWHKVEAILPNYPFALEVEVEGIDTNTAWLDRIGKLRVRVECQFHSNRYIDFYTRTSAWLDSIKRYEENEKLSRTDILLWKKLLHEIVKELIDNATRDVIWSWGERIKDPELLDKLTFKPAPPRKPDGSPYSLSRNRLQLEQEVAKAIKNKCHAWGLELTPIVFELIDVDKLLVKLVNRNLDNEFKDACHQASMDAERIRQRGYAEADVRARNLAALLDVLLNKEGLDLNDRFVTDIVRAALYSDGEMIWTGVIDKGTAGPSGAAAPGGVTGQSGAAPAKTA